MNFWFFAHYEALFSLVLQGNSGLLSACIFCVFEDHSVCSWTCSIRLGTPLLSFPEEVLIKGPSDLIRDNAIVQLQLLHQFNYLCNFFFWRFWAEEPNYWHTNSFWSFQTGFSKPSLDDISEGLSKVGWFTADVWHWLGLHDALRADAPCSGFH